ncbi:MAG: NTP transferase domain-containing protein [Chloroflexota bacterium]
MLRIAVVVLAAGAGTRFGGGKLLAPLAGRPVLAHVLDAVGAAAPAATYLVVGPDGDALAAAAGAGVVTVVRNPDPGRGLASSVAIGVAAAAAGEPAPDAILVALGDQPRIRADVIAALADAAATAAGAGAAFVAPRYADEPDAVVNPVLLLPAAWSRVAGLAGDRGLGPLLVADPGAVLRVPVAGANPDIDTPDDLARLARGRG